MARLRRFQCARHPAAVYQPESSREDLAAAVGQALDALSGEEDEEDEQDDDNSPVYDEQD